MSEPKTTKKSPSIVMKLMNIQSELKAPKNQKNSFGNYNYRSCEDILEAVKPLLLKYKCILTLSDEIIFHQSNSEPKLIEVPSKKGTDYQVIGGDRVYIKATAILSDINEVADGNNRNVILVTAEARESQNKKGMDDSQITGAASSYARKYALNGLFAIDDTKDADSQNNTATGQKPATKPKPTPKEDHVNAQKSKIKKLCESINPLLTKKDEFEKLVKETTKLALVEANYEEIINKLIVITTEK